MARKTWTRPLLLLCLMVSTCNLLRQSSAQVIAEPSDATNQRRQKKTDSALEELRQIGEKIASAVLAKDIRTLLSYGRADMRSQDEVALKDPKSELYCYLFDSSCISWRKQPSVYDKLSQARQPAIKAIDGGKSPYDGHHYALLLFFDRSKVPERKLRSSEFLCEEGRDQLSAWSFKMVEGKWEPVTPFFNFGSDSGCAPK